MEYQKITNLLDTTFDNYLNLLQKTGQKFMISQVALEIDANQVNK